MAEGNHHSRFVSWRNAGLRLIGLALFGAILYLQDWSKIATCLRNIHWIWFSAFWLCFAVMITLRVERTRLAMGRCQKVLPSAASYRITVETSFWGTLTPGRIGEFSKASYLTPYGVPVSMGIALVFLERFYDLLALLVIGAVGIFVGGGLYPALRQLRQVTFDGMVAGVLILIIGYIGRRNRIRSLFWRAIGKFSGFHLTRQFATDLLFIQQRAGWLCGGASVLWVASNVTGAYMLARALSLNVGPLPVGLAYVVSSILSVLPISVAGLGSREAVHILILGSVGVIKEQALLLSILDGFILPFGAIGLLMLVLVLTKDPLQRGFSESFTDVTRDTD